MLFRSDEFVLESEYEFNLIRFEVENSLLLTIKFNSNSNIKESNNSEIEKKTQETPAEELKTPSIERVNCLPYQALFENLEDGKLYTLDPGQKKKLILKVFNNGMKPFPEDTKLVSSKPSISKSINIGAIESGKKISVEIELNAPIIPKKCMVDYKLSCNEGEFGPTASLNIVVMPMGEFEDYKSADVMAELKRFKTELVIAKYQVPKEFQKNLRKLIDIFVYCDVEVILEILKNCGNNSISAINELYLLSKPEEDRKSVV